jgi:hypothetical protein
MKQSLNSEMSDSDWADYISKGMAVDDVARVESILGQNPNLKIEVEQARQLVRAFSQQPLVDAPQSVLNQVLHQAESQARLTRYKAGWAGQFWFQSWFRGLAWSLGLVVLTTTAFFFNRTQFKPPVDVASQQLNSQTAASLSTSRPATEASTGVSQDDPLFKALQLVEQNRLREASVAFEELSQNLDLSSQVRLYTEWLQVLEKLGATDKADQVRAKLQVLKGQ